MIKNLTEDIRYFKSDLRFFGDVQIGGKTILISYLIWL